MQMFAKRLNVFLQTSACMIFFKKLSIIDLKPDDTGLSIIN